MPSAGASFGRDPQKRGWMDMLKDTDRILTTHTGSLPRPAEIEDLLVAIDRDPAVRSGSLDFPRLLDDAVRDIVEGQRAVGIDIVSDGEMSKFGYSTYVRERLTGLDGPPAPLALADLADFPGFASSIKLEITTASCVGPVTFRGAEAVGADVWRLQRALADTGVEKSFMTAASPGIISQFLANNHYSSQEAYLYALADAMKTEYDLIAEAGIILQLDCPDLALGRHLSPQPLPVSEFRKIVALYVEVLNYATRDIDPEQMRLHLCWGNYSSPHHHDVELADIIDLIYRARPAGLSLEAANPRHEHEWTVFEQHSLPDGKVLIPGVIDTCTNYVEHPEVVAQRIKRFADVVGARNLIAGTDCGFATFANFHTIDPGICWLKLKSLADGAALASKALAGRNRVFA
jgi:5-methyltetrahydropteroyltriglutamate--homocysteine methyltransferase